SRSFGFRTTSAIEVPRSGARGFFHGRCRVSAVWMRDTEKKPCQQFACTSASLWRSSSPKGIAKLAVVQRTLALRDVAMGSAAHRACLEQENNTTSINLGASGVDRHQRSANESKALPVRGQEPARLSLVALADRFQ